jgi:hypothetical protein
LVLVEVVMQPRDEQALAIWQAHRKSPEIEALLDQFFNYPTQDQYEAQLDLLRKEFSCPEITSPRSSSLSSGAL